MKRRKLISVLLTATMMQPCLPDVEVMQLRRTQREKQTVRTARKPVE